jgi:peptidoglycan/LPS O-acetylase OafA/YrhL
LAATLSLSRGAMEVAVRVDADASRGRALPPTPDVPGSGSPPRLHWIDWLRVVAIGGVFVYHTLRPFNTDHWHVKNAETSDALNVALIVFSSFGLAVLFLLAGAGMRFALRRRTPRTFIRERVIRLLVPFVVGTALLSPFQGYLQAKQQEAYAGSYLDYLGVWAQGLPGDFTERFSPTAFGVGYHLWFLGFLFSISIVALPACLWLLGRRGQALTDAIASRLGWPASSLVFVVPIYLLMGIGTIFGTEEHDWFEFTWYLAYLLAGFVLIGDSRLIEGVRRDMWPALATAMVTTALIVAGIPVPLDQLGASDAPTKLVVGAVFALEGWAWTLVVLNLGLRWSRFQRPVDEWIGDSVLPVYVFHQPVILAVAFWVVTWPTGIVEKWLAVFSISLPVTLVLVASALRVPALRLLLGTRVRPAPGGRAAVPMPGPGAPVVPHT